MPPPMLLPSYCTYRSLYIPDSELARFIQIRLLDRDHSDDFCLSDNISQWAYVQKGDNERENQLWQLPQPTPFEQLLKNT